MTVDAGPRRLASRQALNLAALAKPKGGLPVFADDLAARLEQQLHEALEPVLRDHDGTALVVNKRDLALAGDSECELKRAVDEADGFSWSVPTAVGTLAHKCCQLRLAAGTVDVDLSPGDVWDLAYQSACQEEWGLGPWLKALPAGEMVELAMLVQQQYSAFVDVFPVERVGRAWQPVAEARMAWEYGPLRSSGKVDVQLGKLWGETGGAARGCIDIKGGRVWHSHRTEQRHYALLHTLRTGVPPRLLGILSLETGVLQVEHVTTDTLWGAAAVFVEAVKGAVRLATPGYEHVARPGGLCRFCPASTDGRCAVGAAHVAHR